MRVPPRRGAIVRGRPRARNRGGRAPAASALRHDRLGVRLPASTPRRARWPGRASASAPDLLGQRGEQAGEQDVGRRVEAEPGSAGRRASRGAGAGRPCRGGSPRRRPGPRRAAARGAAGRCWRAVRVRRRGLGRSSGVVERGQLAVHRVARLVAQGLQHLELHALTVASVGHIFKARLFLFSVMRHSRAGRSPMTTAPTGAGRPRPAPSPSRTFAACSAG